MPIEDTILSTILSQVSKRIIEKVERGKRLSTEDLLILYLDVLYSQMRDMREENAELIRIIEARMTGMESRIASLEKSVASIVASLEALKKSVERLEDDVRSVRGVLEELREAMAELRAALVERRG